MRIALIARGCRPGAGIELYTYELAERLARRHDVCVLADPRNAAVARARLVPVTAPRRPHWYSIYEFSRRAGLEAMRHDFDIVHTQGSDATWGDVVTAHSCHAAGMRASLKLDTGFANRLRKALSPAHRAVVALEQRTFAGAGAVIAVSRRVRRQIRAAYPGVRMRPASVIYPGVDTARYAPEPLDGLRRSVRRQLNLKDDTTVFALAANDPRLKGAARLIRALARVRNSNTGLLIASGAGYDHELGALARRLGVGERVHFLATRGDARPAYAAADVYAALPEYESFGLATLEAMACARPVVLTRNAGAAELLADGREGLLLPALAGAEAVGAAFARLAADADRRRCMGEAARAAAAEHTWDRMAAEVERVYERVLEIKRGDKKAGR